MPEFPRLTLDEFWERLELRGLEPDLQDKLRRRLDRERGRVDRLGDEDDVIAVAARLLPAAVPPRALAVFLDEHFDRQLGRGDESVGLMPRQELLPAGFRALRDAAMERHGGPFAELSEAQQDDVLSQAERGEIPGPEGFDSAQWFKRVLQLLLLGLGSDPRGMVQMGFPGPSYRPGHLWLDRREVVARAQRKRGYRYL